MRLRVLILLAAAALLSPQGALAQGNELAESYDRGVTAMEAGNYEEGLALVDAVIEKSAATALGRHGPVFGHFFYLKGMLLIRQGDYEAAIEPLRVCYEDYPSSAVQDGQLPNAFQIHALMQWAGCLQALGQYEEAIAKYEQTLAEDPRKNPPINRIFVQINIARCHSQMGDEAKSEEILRTVLGSEEADGTALQEAFLALAADWDPNASLQELFEVVADTPLNIDRSTIFPAALTGRLATMASRALNSSKPLRALTWYQMMTPPGATVDAEQKRLEALQERRATVPPNANEDAVAALDNEISAAEAALATAEEIEAASLIGLAGAHYQMGNLAAARAGYRTLVAEHEDLPDYPFFLHNLLICTANLGRWEEAREAGAQFLNAYADHELRPSVSRVLSEVIFVDGLYEEALQVAGDSREDLSPGDPDRDVPDFVVGASLFQLERFAEAQQELAAYVENYPEGKRLETAQFFLATSLTRLGRWAEAGPIFNDFIQVYPASVMRATVLYLGALSNLIANQPDLALVHANYLLRDFPSDPQIAAIHNVKGDVLRSQEAPVEEIQQQYEMARTMAVPAGKPEVAAYALRQLLALSSDEQDWDRALEIYETFTTEHANSPLRAETELAAIDALVARDRAEEARENLERVILDTAKTFEVGTLDDLFRSYLDFLVSNFGEEEALKAVQEFPTPGAVPPALNAWVSLAEVELLEAMDAEAEADRISELFYRLNAIYEESGSELGNYPLFRLARWNLLERKDQAAAEAIYDGILEGNPSGETKALTMIDRARLEAESDDPLGKDKALQKFQQVLAEMDDPSVIEGAVLGAARILTSQGKYDKAIPLWEQYMEARGWNQARPEASFRYAHSLERSGRREEALKGYLAVYANFTGHLDWSTQAAIRAGELLRQKDQAVDALKVLQDLLRRTTGSEHPGVEEVKKVFFQWRDEL